jgi:hypothetical protein
MIVTRRGTNLSAATLLSLLSGNQASVQSAIGWIVGSGAPDNSLGVNGNAYLDVDSCVVYKKAAGAWVAESEPSGGELHYFTAMPSNTYGVNEDFGILSSAGVNASLLQKVAGEWVVLSTFPQFTASLALKESLMALSICRPVFPNSSFINTSGSGSAALNDSYGVSMMGGTTANAWQRGQLTRLITGNPGSSAAPALATVPFALAVALFPFIESVSGTSELRLVIGDSGSGAPPAIGSNAVAGKAFGLRIYYSAANSRIEGKLFTHDGTTYAESSAIAFTANDSVNGKLQNVVISTNGAGTIKLFYSPNNTTNSGGVRSSDAAALTLAGGPASGTLVGQHAVLLILNAATPPTSQSAIRQINAMIHTNTTDY